MIKISEDELPGLSVEVAGISNKTLAQIYLFYKDGKHSQSDNYLVETNKPKTQLITTEFLAYSLLGIYFPNDQILDSRRYMLFLNEEDLKNRNSLAAAIEREKAAIGCLTFDYCYVDKNYVYERDRRDDGKLIREFFQGIVFVNDGFVESTSRLSIKTDSKDDGMLHAESILNEEFYDIADFSVVTNVNRVLRTAKRISSEMKIGEYKAVTFNPLGLDQRIRNSGIVENSVKRMYYTIAAYLMITESINFDVYKGEMGSIEFTSVLNILNMFTSRECNYAGDFLSIVQDPIEAGMIIRNKNLYLCIKDEKVYRSNYNKFRSTVSGVGIEFDVKKRRLVSSESKDFQFYLDSMELLDLRKVFKIGEDWTASFEGAKELAKVIVDLCNVLKKKISFVHQGSPDITNLVLAKCDGKVYLVYIVRIESSRPYMIMPMDASFRGYPIALTYAEYGKIIDLRAASDGNKYIGFLHSNKWVQGPCKMWLPPHHRGILCSEVRSQKSPIKWQDLDLSFEEVNVWFGRSRQFRGTNSYGILKCLTEEAAFNCGLLSYYGGPLIDRASGFNIIPSYWR